MRYGNDPALKERHARRREINAAKRKRNRAKRADDLALARLRKEVCDPDEAGLWMLYATRGEHP